MTFRLSDPSASSTMFGWPTGTIASLERGGYAVVGVPQDATGARVGTHLGPAAIRAASHKLPTGPHRDLRAGVDVDYNIVAGIDLGDLRCTTDVRQLVADASAVTAAVVDSGATPIGLGGDHFVTYPLAKGYFAAKRSAGCTRIGYVQIDQHCDLVRSVDGYVDGLTNGVNARRVSELDGADPSAFAWIGPQWAEPEEADWLAASGATVISDDHVRVDGVAAIAARVLDDVCGGCDAIYLTIDVDVLDHVYGPGVAARNIGGLTSRQLVDLAGLLGRDHRVAAVDVVEVAPQRDPLGMTSFVAAAALQAFLASRRDATA